MQSSERAAIPKRTGPSAFSFGSPAYNAEHAFIVCDASKGPRKADCKALAEELTACFKSVMGSGAYKGKRGCDEERLSVLACLYEQR